MAWNKRLFIIIFGVLINHSYTFAQFLENSVCNNDQDCYIRDRELTLACYSNVNKCRCQSTIRSIYNLKYENNECLMSKYGPCGVSPTNPNVKVGCSDGFHCIENRCRDPNVPNKTVNSVYTFDTGSCEACRFSDDLHLQCGGRNEGQEHCFCGKVDIPDGRYTSWDIRSYDGNGNKNCSVGRYGPCGSRNGIKIECHGEGIECVNGICTNPNHPLSNVNEVCEKRENCEPNLICSYSKICIIPKSSQRGTPCYTDEECQPDTKCNHDPKFGFWAPSQCS